MPTYYIPILVLFLVLLLVLHRRKLMIARYVMKKRKTEETEKMVELAKRLIGKDCLIYSFDGSHQFSGVIQEVSDHGMLVERNGEIEVINLDFVIRIREFPKDKKGKKKSVVLD